MLRVASLAPARLAPHRSKGRRGLGHKMVFARTQEEVFQKWRDLGISGTPEDQDAQRINKERI